MRAGALVLFCIAVAVSAMAVPPDRGGVMMALDSSLVLYWVHPEINSFEQGFDDESENLPLVGGEEIGSYAMVVEFTVPFAACVTSIRMRISMTDQFPESPGDRYSPFHTAVYESGPDGIPMEPPLWTDSGRMCGGEPCFEEWFEQTIHLSDLSPGALWQAFLWADSTPAAPQLMGRLRRVDDPPVLIGRNDGDGMIWDALYYIPAIRQRLLGMVPLDTNVAVGWRRPVAAVNRPDSFLIFLFHDDTVTDEFFHNNTDTLICRLPKTEFDSAVVRSCYDGIVDDTAWSIEIEKSKMPPILADLYFPDAKMNPSATLSVVNLADEPISLRLAYDHGTITLDTDTLFLAGHESRLISGELIEPPGDTLDVMIVLAGDDDSYYPFVVQSTYPQSGQTDAGESGEDYPDAHDPSVTIFPNPCAKSVTVADGNYRDIREIAVFNVIGQRVARIAPPYRARMIWNGCDRDGRAVPPGIYFVRIRYDDAAVTKSVLLMR